MPTQPRRPGGSQEGGQFTSRPLVESDADLAVPPGITAITPTAREQILVPRIGHEPQVWDPPSGYGVTRRERSARGRTYQSAVTPRIGELKLTFPAGLVADAEEAAAQIARFDEATEHALGAITAVLLRSESASSSQIEQISASARAIAEAELTGSGSANAVVIADNSHAMVEAVSSGDTLSAAGIVGIQRILLERHSPHLVGWRTEPVWIGGSGSTPPTADYVAPDHRRIPDAIDDLVQFAARDDLPILPQIAIAHAQFEAIHPFADGNGRTGRALVQVLLRAKQLTRKATIPISGGLLVEKERYFEALGAYRAGDAAPILEQFGRASLRAVQHGQMLSTGMSALRDGWHERLNLRADSTAWKIIDLLPAFPVIDAETVAARTGIHPNNVRRAIAPLVDAGILVGRQHDKSHKYLYRAPEVLEILDSYAAEVGRRGR